MTSSQPKPSKVLVIGSGPIVIGQAAEFDYAGTQACKALREEGVTTVLVNSNPATIMTDEDIADVVYIEPLTVEVLERVIARERPDGVLPTLGGQTGLNLAVELADAGILERYGVRLLGTPLQTIRNAEDRELFRNLLVSIGEPVPPSAIVESLQDARAVMDDIGLPLVIRPAYTLGGTGGGIANTEIEFEQTVSGGIAASPIGQVLIEKSLVGWKEIEYEVMRDGADNCITICNMENIDPMGVHTGDSIVVAPSQTLSDKEYQLLRSASLKIIRALGIEGGCNIQMALEPGEVVAETLPNGGRAESAYYIIEVNPRVSRSSALASKATGYPIARVAAKIAVGKRLDEIPNAVTKQTLAAFEPALDYCVVKIPRWPFDKFPRGDRRIGTQMKATGEVMAIDRSFSAAFQKAVRSLEITNRSLLWEDRSWTLPSQSPPKGGRGVLESSHTRGESGGGESLPIRSNDDRLRVDSSSTTPPSQSPPRGGRGVLESSHTKGESGVPESSHTKGESGVPESSHTRGGSGVLERLPIRSNDERLWEDRSWTTPPSQSPPRGGRGVLENSHTRGGRSGGESPTARGGRGVGERATAADVLKNLPISPNDERLWALMAALRRGCGANELSRATGIDPWFTREFERIARMEDRLMGETLTPGLLWMAKRLGFGDGKIAALTDRNPEQVRDLRHEWGIRPVYKMVDTCAAEFEAQTPYFYSTYEQENEALPSPASKALVLGSGPIRIGQGIEFDYCSVHAAWALQEEGIQSVMANSNPETVSTDFDTSDRLYFEPLDEESVRDILENEAFESGQEGASIPPSMVQFGGQTAIDLSQALARADMPILGSTAQSIDIASDRHLFEEFLAHVGIPNPPGSAVMDLEQALNVAQEIGYPVLVRPSYVLGGRAMEIVQNASELVRYMTSAFEAGSGRRVLIDKYFEGREVEVDAVCDGETVLIPGIMEHVERAGVHSGDSMAIYPGLTLSEAEVNTVVDYTTRIGRALQVRGLMNIQYVLVGGPAYRSPQSGGAGGNAEVYVIEVNPRSSRTIPFISKVTGVPVVRLAVKVMLGRTLNELGYEGGLWKRQKLVGVKAPVFSMSKLTGVDTYLGPEMKSTGEVMGIDADFTPAVAKALMAAGLTIRPGDSALLSIADRDKAESVQMIRDLHSAGCIMYATEGTAAMISGLGLPCVPIPKRLSAGHPNVVDVIEDGTVRVVVNTVTGDRDTLQDGFHIRRAATEARIPCFTSLDTARAAVESMVGSGAEYSVKPLPEYRNAPR